MLYDNLAVTEGGHLTIAGHDARALADQFGTPLYLLDEALIRSRCRTYKQAMEAAFRPGSMPFYASKALSFKHIYEIALEEGLGVDVVSAGELYTAKAAGFPMQKVCFHGNNKTDAEIELAMDYGVGHFVCDGADELEAIELAAARRGIRQNVLLRLSPGIDPHTHAKIATGQVDSKFGSAIETGQAAQLVAQILKQRHIKLLGFHCHIGSQIVDHQPFCDAAVIMLTFAAEIRRNLSYEAQIISLGGGLAVRYVEQDPVVDYGACIEKTGVLVRETCEKLGIETPQIWMEPGRSLVADAGVTLYTVGAVKEIPGFKNYISIDGGMTDNPRFALYQADYTVLAADRMLDAADFRCTLAGRCCESGDVIQENILLPRLQRGDLVAVLTTGAYNYAMASNYNRVPRPPIVMLGENGPYLTVRRESLDDLIQNDL